MLPIGVAKPKAQGQAITTTDIAVIKPFSKELTPNQYKNVRIAIERIATEKYPEIIFANCSIFGFLVTASPQKMDDILEHRFIRFSYSFKSNN